MKTVTITVPDEMHHEDIADYVLFVSEQIREMYLSGHVGIDHYWTSEGRLS